MSEVDSDPQSVARRAALSATVLALQGILLSLGGGSSLGALSGQGPLGKTVATVHVFVAYGYASMFLLAVATVMLLFAHRRYRPREWPRFTHMVLALPSAGLIAGSGSGFFTATYGWLVKVQWSLGGGPADPPLTAIGCLVLASWPLLPATMIVVMVAARSTPHAVLAVLGVAVGYEIGFMLEGEIQQRLLNFEGISPPHVWVVMVVAAGTLTRVLASRSPTR